MSAKVLIAAGGTGGHIFPGLALALALREQGCAVHWLGGRQHGAAPSMECREVPQHGIDISTIEFGGLRAKGWMQWVLLPWRLLRALWQTLQVLQRVRPDVVVGMGGYLSFPAGVAAVLRGIPLVVHEQNAVTGLANRLLFRLARERFTAFPSIHPAAQWVGNPLRSSFAMQGAPQERYAARTGRLRLLVMGGSLGAQALNTVVPEALAGMEESRRPEVVHQCGRAHIDTVRACYAEAGVDAEVLPFLEDPAQAMANADVVLCRAGAGTVTEIAAVGVASVFVPYPYAVDDHQTHNARVLVDAGAAWLIPQDRFTSAVWRDWLLRASRTELQQRAIRAQTMAKPDADRQVAAACLRLSEHAAGATLFPPSFPR
ncbi:undecaprenyldiphospho-muramoylpentapeptide beta-N-acetylglucosaminyltransferase [Candidatus Symbiobacter mobilis]|uniref:UDP-N-acetylglucosamine--N-acetylmuramyl-(pentapeptide) pyrophosphoryl-undecaprenol N-acetylglucosamine transferase n=1 Tax=Candidatus Symbiobacter mobilis CR TaxID=946483 RepID=U5N6T1_9BURK|nr:undecaprenyldiphospho-muramoylpentapeptide beta-N-acetylglucosaminyltransferase [Candidatus Symbiobacter mobilis]AGX86990.1 UDP-N-acetylglucosamine:LPS N-acetylglucosamine transferase [Candidatus Symbiobacter mobilis CR]